MIRYISNENHQAIYIRPDDEHSVECFSTNKVWSGQQFNLIVKSCIGPNKVSIAPDIELEPSEMKSLLKFVLGEDICKDI